MNLTYLNDSIMVLFCIFGIIGRFSILNLIDDYLRQEATIVKNLGRNQQYRFLFYFELNKQNKLGLFGDTFSVIGNALIFMIAIPNINSISAVMVPSKLPS